MIRIDCDCYRLCECWTFMDWNITGWRGWLTTGTILFFWLFTAVLRLPSSWRLDRKWGTQSSHGAFFDDIGVYFAIAEQPLGEEAEDDAGESEAHDLFIGIFSDLLEFGFIHLKTVEAVQFFHILRHERFLTCSRFNFLIFIIVLLRHGNWYVWYIWLISSFWSIPGQNYNNKLKGGWVR